MKKLICEEEIKEVTCFTATGIKCKCPYCDEYIDGWMGDPGGVIEKCDWCGKCFKVSNNFDIEYT